MVKLSVKKRCQWVGDDALSIKYHDKEWGRPVHDDQTLFEFLILEGAQAGLSWITILRKRENYQKLFFNFDVTKCARLTDSRIEKLLQDPGIIRNRLKVASVRTNAKAFIKIQKEFGSFSRYIWQFVDGKTLLNSWESLAQIPASSDISDKIAKDLKKRGFKFIGTTICYAFMQAIGMVHDHTVDCFLYNSL